MAQLNQRIPNFLGGVSQQPDKIKFPGQLRVCDNAVPDITFGLTKRPPAEQIKSLATATSGGFWYEILRDGDEKYLVQITPFITNTSSNMPIRIWDLADGTEKSLTNSSGDALFDYLKQLASNQKPYAVTSIQDYTLIANPEKTVSNAGLTESPIDNGDYAFARLDTIAYNTEYVLYSGTAPNPKNYFRVTAIKVDLDDGGTLVGPTYEETSDDSKRAGQLTWSFSADPATSAVNGTNSNKGNCEGIEGSLQVNGTPYIASYEENFNGNSTASEDFLGYTQDYDTRYTATVTLTDGGLIREENENTALGKYLAVVLEGKRYRISVEAVEKVVTYRDVNGIGYFKTPKNPDEGPLSMSTILEGLKDSVNSNLSGVTAEVIGSGLYLNGSSASSVNFLGGAVNENMSVIGQKAQDISRLPAMCKQGYVAQISNTSDTDVDDYYVKFEASNGASGVGSWEECVRPNNFSTSTSGVTTLTNIPYQMQAGTQSGFSGIVTFGTVGATSGNLATFLSNSGSDIVTSSFGNLGSAITVTNITPAQSSSNLGTFTNGSQVFITSTGTGHIRTGRPSGFGNFSNHLGTCTIQITIDPMILGLDPGSMPHALINNRNGTFTFAKLDEATATSQGNQNYWKDRQVGDDTSNPFPSFLGNGIQNMFFHRNRLALVSGEFVVMSRPSQYFDFFIVSAITVSDDNPIDITMNDVKPAFVNHTLPINKGMLLFSDSGQFLLFSESDILSAKTARIKKLASYECDATIKPVDLGTSVLFTSNVSSHARAFEATILDDDTPPNIIEQTRVVPEFLPKDITISTNSAALGITSYAKKGDKTIYHYKYYNVGAERQQSAWYTWSYSSTVQHMVYTGGSFFVVLYDGTSYQLVRHEFVPAVNVTPFKTLTFDNIDWSTQAGSQNVFDNPIKFATASQWEAIYNQITGYVDIGSGSNFGGTSVIGSKVTATNITNPTGYFVNDAELELVSSQPTFGRAGIRGQTGPTSGSGTCTLTIELNQIVNPSSYVVGDLPTNIGSPLDTDRTIETCLDFSVTTDYRVKSTAHSVPATASTQAYEEFSGNSATVNWPTLTDLVVVGLNGRDRNGVDVAGMVLPVDEISGSNVRVFNSGLDLALLSSTAKHSANFAIGYKYKTIIELPNYYLNVGNNVYDTNGDLRISGINFELGLSGPMEFHLTSPFSYTDANGNVTKDIDDYVQYESGILTNLSKLNTIPSELDKSVRVPIQRKNNKYNLQIQIPDPFSTAIISASWDGNYSNKRHVRR